MRRDVVERCEVPFLHLLAARSNVEGDDFDVERVGEVGDGRVVEREVAVLAEPAAREIERMRLQQDRVLCRFEFGVAGVSVEVVELA